MQYNSERIGLSICSSQVCLFIWVLLLHCMFIKRSITSVHNQGIIISTFYVNAKFPLVYTWSRSPESSLPHTRKHARTRNLLDLMNVLCAFNASQVNITRASTNGSKDKMRTTHRTNTTISREETDERNARFWIEHLQKKQCHGIK